MSFCSAKHVWLNIAKLACSLNHGMCISAARFLLKGLPWIFLPLLLTIQIFSFKAQTEVKSLLFPNSLFSEWRTCLWSFVSLIVVLFFGHLAFATFPFTPQGPHNSFYSPRSICRDMASLIALSQILSLKFGIFFLSDSFNAQRMNILKMPNDW